MADVLRLVGIRFRHYQISPETPEDANKPEKQAWSWQTATVYPWHLRFLVLQRFGGCGRFSLRLGRALSWILSESLGEVSLDRLCALWITVNYLYIYITDAVIWSILLLELVSVTFLKSVPLGFSSLSFLISSSDFSFPFLLLDCVVRYLNPHYMSPTALRVQAG